MFTIITSTLNCKNELRKTAVSIANQSFQQIQWIVIDGFSTDGTLDVIKEFKKYISFTISEPDSGIYDAWNKACKHIQNNWVIFLGAGDVFVNRDTLLNASIFLSSLDSNFSYVYGDVLSDSIPPRKLFSGEIMNNEWDLYRPKLPYHQGVFHNLIYFQGDNTFDCTYKIVSDSKFLLKLNSYADRKYMPIEICIMASGGVSQTPKNTILVMMEFLQLENEMGYKIPIVLKVKFIFVTFAKVFIYKFFGLKFFNRIHAINFRLKQFLS